jgi:diguanylate cyclase (GGDEF)-like protein
MLMLLVRFVPKCAPALSTLAITSMSGYLYWLGIPWFAAVMALSIRQVRDECYLGGILAGCALIYAVGWHGQMAGARGAGFESLVFAIAPLYLEFGILIHWFVRMEQRIAYDPLLHIYNRDYCSRIISEQSSLNVNPPCAVAMVDIDFFKKVNDTYGHQAGDHVLYTIAQSISREIMPHGVLCRYGGEELIIFFPQKTAKQVSPLMEKVRATIEKLKIHTQKKKISVTVSIGVSCRDEQDHAIIDAIKAADKALYRAKKGGRNQVRIGKNGAASAKK